MKKPVIVISSHVVRGSVGNRAAVFALEVLGHPVWAVPTITLPFHPGHGPATRIVPDEDQFAALLGDLEASPWIGEVAAVLTGYMATAAQARLVGAFIARLKANHAGLLHACDPVMGDHGKLYVGADTAAAICDCLVAQADILTPNRFEFGRLAGLDMPEARAAIAACDRLHAQTVLITSMPGMMRGNLGNLLICGGKAWMAEHRRLDHPPNGPGDLTAALLLSHLLDGAAPEEALRRVTASVFEIVAHAAGQRADELMLEADAGSIRQPRANVMVRSFG
ncbi:MAG: pyridoxal kinase [Nitratireductor sp.]|nr:pyridoxal kinase [Nitratireductor sp.]